MELRWVALAGIQVMEMYALFRSKGIAGSASGSASADYTADAFQQAVACCRFGVFATRTDVFPESTVKEFRVALGTAFCKSLARNTGK